MEFIKTSQGTVCLLLICISASEPHLQATACKFTLSMNHVHVFMYIYVHSSGGQVLQAKGRVTAAEVAEQIEKLQSTGAGNALGARIVARAWIDAAFKSKLLKDAGAALADVDISIPGFPPNGGMTGSSCLQAQTACYCPSVTSFKVAKSSFVMMSHLAWIH